MGFSLIALTIPLIWLSHLHTSSPEPIVTLRFYKPWVFKVNVKEYISVNETGRTTISCDVNNFLPFSSGTIVLSSGNTTLKESLLSNRPLIWKGIISLPSNLSCTALLRNQTAIGNNMKSWGSNIKYTVRVTALDFHPSKGTSKGVCLPREDSGKFLQNEVVPIICVSDEKPANWTSSVDLLTTTEGLLRLPSNRRVIQNYIRLLAEPLSGKITRCIQRKDDSNTFCEIRHASLKSKHDTLSITMNPVAIPKDVLSAPLRFTCKTNVPTERISWRAESSWGNILDFGSEYVPKWNISISNYRSTSELTFPPGINRLIVVSCWTDRAGYVAMAKASNQSGPHEMIMMQPHLMTQTSSATSSKYFIVTVGLALACLSLLFAIILILRRKRQRSQTGSEVVGYVLSDPAITQNIQPSVYTSIRDLNTTENENMGSKQDTRTKKTRRSTDELSIAILDEESEEYIYNTIYDCIE